jgi:YtkA-like
VTGARVGCDMTMPAMPMPPNHPTVVESSPGVYRMEVMFTMAGDWEATVQALLPDGSVNEFVFAMTAR